MTEMTEMMTSEDKYEEFGFEFQDMIEQPQERSPMRMKKAADTFLWSNADTFGGSSELQVPDVSLLRTMSEDFDVENEELQMLQVVPTSSRPPATIKEETQEQLAEEAEAEEERMLQQAAKFEEQSDTFFTTAPRVPDAKPKISKRKRKQRIVDSHTDTEIESDNSDPEYIPSAHVTKRGRRTCTVRPAKVANKTRATPKKKKKAAAADEDFEANIEGEIRLETLDDEERAELERDLETRIQELKKTWAATEHLAARERKRARNRQASSVSRLRRKLAVANLKDKHSKAIGQLEQVASITTTERNNAMALWARLQKYEPAFPRPKFADISFDHCRFDEHKPKSRNHYH